MKYRFFFLVIALFSLVSLNAYAQTTSETQDDVATGFVASFVRMAAGSESFDNLNSLDGIDEEATAAIAELRRDIGNLVHYSVIFECAASVRATGGVWDKTRPYILSEFAALANPLILGGAEQMIRQEIIDTSVFAFSNAKTPEGFFSRMLGGISGSNARFSNLNETIVEAAIEAAKMDDCGDRAFLIQENALLFSAGISPISLEGMNAFLDLRLSRQNDVVWGPNAFGSYQMPDLYYPVLRDLYSDYLESEPLSDATIKVCRYTSSSGAEFVSIAMQSVWRFDVPLRDLLMLLRSHGLTREVGLNTNCERHPDGKAPSNGYRSYAFARANAIHILEAQLRE